MLGSSLYGSTTNHFNNNSNNVWRTRGREQTGACRRRCLAAAAALLMALLACPALPASADDGGWTEFTPSVDTRIIYVSSSEGVSSPNDLSYSPGHPDIGPDPFNPVGDVHAYRTIAEAYQHLRDGRPDWILLKRGDTWNEGFANPSAKWDKSGRSETERMLIGAYGPAVDRPVITTFYTYYGAGQQEHEFDHVAVTSLEFSEGFDRRIGGRDFLIEDCYLYEAGFAVQGFGPVEDRTYLFDVAIRRCVSFRAHNPHNNRASSLYVAMVDGLLIEECLFDHGGWKPGVVEPNLVSHNVYLQRNVTNVVFRDNISSRASSHGVQMRAGGLCEDNLFLQNPISILLGDKDLAWPSDAARGAIRGNVVIDGRDIQESARGFGIWIERADGVVVEDNLIAHQESGSFARALSFEDRYQNIKIRNNIVYDWTHGFDDFQWGACLSLSDTILGDLNFVEDNIFQEVGGGHMVIHGVPMDGITWRRNTYYTTNVEDEWFFPSRTYEAWLVASGETGSEQREVNFRDPGRNIDSYMSHIGTPGDLAAFLQQARRQSKKNWRPEYTAAAVIDYMRDGFDMEGGGGQSVDIERIDVIYGQHIRGGVPEVRASDDRYFVVAARPSQNHAEPYTATIEAQAAGPPLRAASMQVTLEQRAATAGGVATLSLWNRWTREFDPVWTGAMGLGDTRAVVPVQWPIRYYSEQTGHVLLRLQHSSLIPFDPFGFLSHFDVIDIQVN